MNFLFGLFIISLPVLFIVILLIVINFPSFSKSKEDNKTTSSSAYLENLLLELNSIEGRRGFKQLNRLKYKTYKIKDILKTKFNVNEVTYIKYIDSINEVYCIFLRNLEKHYLIKKNIESLDKVKWFDGLKNNEEKQRYSLIKNMNVEANNLLFQNEKALFKLDVLEIGISSINDFDYRKVDSSKECLIKLSKKIHCEKQPY